MIHRIDQNTDEWMELRMGKITASNFATIMANDGKAFGKPAITYAQKVAIESYTHRSIESYTNEWMERGKEQEDAARDAYKAHMFVDVHPGDFAEDETGTYGASSDGQVEGGGLIEIKCVKYNTHFERLLKGSYDTSYRWQILGNLWLYDQEWCDFVSYCSDFPVSKQLYVFRVFRDRAVEAGMISRLTDFANQVNLFKSILT